MPGGGSRLAVGVLCEVNFTMDAGGGSSLEVGALCEVNFTMDAGGGLKLGGRGPV